MQVHVHVLLPLILCYFPLPFPLFLALKFVVIPIILLSIALVRQILLFAVVFGLVVAVGSALGCAFVVVDLGVASVFSAARVLLMSPLLASLALALAVPQLFLRK